MNILITGYSGFVGSNLVGLLKNSYSLNFLGRKEFKIGTVYSHSIDANSNYSEALTGVDVVIHCAARVHVMNDTSTDPLTEFRAVNTFGTFNLAKQAAQTGVKRFIFLSSIKVNGESTSGQMPFTAPGKQAAEDPYGIPSNTMVIALGH